MSDHRGFFTLIRQAKPKSRWESVNRKLKRALDTPCYDPNWSIRFYVAGRPQLTKSGPDDVTFRICEKCMAQGPECGGAMKTRLTCECQKWPRKWAEQFLTTQHHLLMVGEVQKLEAMRAPEVWTPFPEALSAYEERGPSDAGKRVAYLRTMIAVVHGIPDDKMDWHHITKGLAFDFAAMWQTAAQIGLHAREERERFGAAEKESLRLKFNELLRKVRTAGGRTRMELFAKRREIAEQRRAAMAELKNGLPRARFLEGEWAALRKEMTWPLDHPKRRVKAVDMRTVMKCNTTIRGYIDKVQAMFETRSRDNYLRGMKIPPLREFLETSVIVALPKGHQEFTKKDYMAILDGLPELRRSKPSVWLVNQMLMRFALRPEEIFPSRPGWLEEIQQNKKKRTRINIINRPEEGFELKTGANAKPRHIWVPEDMLACMREVQNETSLIGGRHKSAARDLVERDHPQWLREIGVEVDRPNYKFRHFALAERMTSSESATAAGALGGHSTGATAEKNYARVLGTLEPLSDAEIYRRFLAEE